jgi:hypothetical protein
LEVTFGEDKSRIRKGNGSENFGTMRRQTLGLLKKDTPLKQSIRLEKYHAAMDMDNNYYRSYVLDFDAFAVHCRLAPISKYLDPRWCNSPDRNLSINIVVCQRRFSGREAAAMV